MVKTAIKPNRTIEGRSLSQQKERKLLLKGIRVFRNLEEALEWALAKDRA